MVEFNEIDLKVQELAASLRKHPATLVLAESCTGGLLSSWITKSPGVSDFYLGAIVSYANSLKEGLIHVRPESLAQHGAVSEVVAKEMVLGAKLVTKADWGLAVTGVAGPSGGSVEKPVGLVWFACSGPGFEGQALSEKKNFIGSRAEIQKQAASWGLQWLIENINNNTFQGGK